MTAAEILARAIYALLGPIQDDLQDQIAAVLAPMGLRLTAAKTAITHEPHPPRPGHTVVDEGWLAQ